MFLSLRAGILFSQIWNLDMSKLSPGFIMFWNGFYVDPVTVFFKQKSVGNFQGINSTLSSTPSRFEREWKMFTGDVLIKYDKDRMTDTPRHIHFFTPYILLSSTPWLQIIDSRVSRQSLFWKSIQETGKGRDKKTIQELQTKTDNTPIVDYVNETVCFTYTHIGRSAQSSSYRLFWYLEKQDPKLFHPIVYRRVP